MQEVPGFIGFARRVRQTVRTILCAPSAGQLDPRRQQGADGTPRRSADDGAVDPDKPDG
jgi:hypothetical protein